MRNKKSFASVVLCLLCLTFNICNVYAADSVVVTGEHDLLNIVWAITFFVALIFHAIGFVKLVMIVHADEEDEDEEDDEYEDADEEGGNGYQQAIIMIVIGFALPIFALIMQEIVINRSYVEIVNLVKKACEFTKLLILQIFR